MLTPDVLSPTFILDALVKGFVILLVAFGIDLIFLKKANASTRHLLWMVALTSTLILPLASLVLPSLDVPILLIESEAAISPELMTGSVSGPEGTFRLSGIEILIYLYCIGVVLVFLWQMMGRLYAYSLKMRAQKITDPELLSTAENLRREMGIKRPVDLFRCEIVGIPFSTGFLKPAVVLPVVIHTWPASVVKTVLVHEMAHIKRKDILVRLIAQLSCCWQWINPMAWYGFGRLLTEQEIACDDFVLGTGTKPSDYARNLLALAKVRAGRLHFAATAFGRKTELKDRLLEILKPKRSKTPCGICRTIVYTTVTTALLLPLSALNVWQSELTESKELKTISKEDPSSVPTTPKKQDENTHTENLPAAIPPPPPKLTKETISKMLQKMKKDGASEAEIEEFTKKAKEKLLQIEKRKKAAEEEQLKKELQSKPKALQEKPKEKITTGTSGRPILQLA